MGKKRCKHETFSIEETIEAYHQRIMETNPDSYYCNNEYGNRIRVEAICICGFRKRITNYNQNSLPLWLRKRINIIKDEEWFFCTKPKI